MNEKELLNELKDYFVGEEMTLLELSNAMMKFDFNSIFDEGDVNEFAESGSIVFTSGLKDENDEYIEYLVYLDIVERNVDDEDEEIFTIKVTDIEIF